MLRYRDFGEIPELDIDDAPHFGRHESLCNCGQCNQNIIIPQLVWLIELTRMIYGKPIRVNSWNRCPDWNLSEGGAKESSHLLGYAIDIATRDKYERRELYDAASEAGFPIIKLRWNHIHLDVNHEKPWAVLLL